MSTITFNPVPSDTPIEIAPALVIGYQTSRESGNIVHTIIGRSDPVVTLRPAKLRTGTLGMLFTTEADAWACVNAHAGTGTFTYADSDLTGADMTYVVDGSVNIQLDEGTQTVWMVSVDYQEVL